MAGAVSHSALTHLECPECGRHFEADQPQTFCANCKGSPRGHSPLLARYDLEKARRSLDPSTGSGLSPKLVAARPRGLWRWGEILPVRSDAFRLTEFVIPTAGLRVPGPFADRLILRALRESGGAARAVSDEEIGESQREMARLEGVFVAPEGAAALAALKHLLASGRVKLDERVVLFNTGTGLKYL